MLRYIILLLLMLSTLYANTSHILGYDRVIIKDQKVEYAQRDGNFSLSPQQIIDTHNIYHKGSVDNYDDPYIETIMKSQEVFYTIEGSSKVHIIVAFKDKENRVNFLKEFGLGIFKEQNMSISLVQMDTRKITLPMKPNVYPLFVIGSRYVQGIISKKILKSLVTESNYDTVKNKIDISTLYAQLKQKFSKTKNDTTINYNKKKELFEVHEVNQTKIHSYISKDGRYILVK